MLTVLWTEAQHIAERSRRYPDADDIQVPWADEAVADAKAVVRDPDPRSRTGAVRIIGYSPTAGYLITVIAVRAGGSLWGMTAWKATGGDRRAYRGAAEGD